MLTKQEISKKKTYASDDDSVAEVSSDDQKLHKKRLFIVLAILLTIGLSLAFIVYRQVREIIKNPAPHLPKLPNISISNFNGTPNKNIFDLTSTISSIIDKDETKWNIVVFREPNIYNWPSNKTTLDRSPVNAMVSKISKLPPSNLLADLLPQGLILKEESISQPQFQKLSLLVSTPDQQLLLIDLEYQGTPVEFQTIITQLVPAIYWNAVPPQIN